MKHYLSLLLMAVMVGCGEKKTETAKITIDTSLITTKSWVGTIETAEIHDTTYHQEVRYAGDGVYCLHTYVKTDRNQEDWYDKDDYRGEMTYNWPTFPPYSKKVYSNFKHIKSIKKKEFQKAFDYFNQQKRIQDSVRILNNLK